jgi:hypothetical protein
MSNGTNVPIEWEILNSANGGEIIDSRSVAQRLDDMADEHLYDDGEAIPVSGWPDVAQAEHAALTTLLKDIGDNLPDGYRLSANGDAMILIRDTYLSEFVKQDYDDLYGGDLHTEDRNGNMSRLSWSELMDREPFKWINWDDVADAWRERCAEVEYHGVTYYLDH